MGDRPPTGENLHRYRYDANITQKEMAYCLGISERQYQRLEAGHCEMSWKLMQRASEVLDIKPYELFIEWDGVPS